MVKYNKQRIGINGSGWDGGGGGGGGVGVILIPMT